jgi:hypothetical protein
MAVHTIPIANRPPASWSRRVQAILFLIVFVTGCIIINGFQFILLPLTLLPFKWTKRLYTAGIRYTKGAFGCLESTLFSAPFCSLAHYPRLQVLMCQWFAPTNLIVTFETEGKGAFSQHEIEQYIIKDADNNPVALDLPTKFVLIANHQVL